MKKKVLLVNPSSRDSKGMNEATIYPPLGLAYLASYLREKSTIHTYEIKIIDANVLNLPNEEIIKSVRKFNPDVVGIHTNIVLGKNAAKLSKMIKTIFPHILICLGGALASSNPKEVLDMSSSDISIVGEGEITFLEICEGKELSGIKGIVYYKGGKVVFNAPRKLMENLDDLPHPAFDLLPNFKIYPSRARKKPVAPIMTSRGCPFQCTFCNTKIFGKAYRPHTPEYIIKQIDILVNKFGVKQLDILDDNFTLNIERAEKILDLIIERGYKILINLQNGVRADRLTENLVKKMRRAGIFKTAIGVESGNKEILKSIKKSLDLNDVIRAIALFRKYKIITMGYFMIGFPDDTKETINETIDFAIRANPTYATFSTLVPLQGTEIYDHLKENNLLLSEKLCYDSGYFSSKENFKSEHLTHDELLSLEKKAYSRFNFRISKVFEMICGIKSFNEFKWLIVASISILRNIILKSN
ncbi:MAG: radical SAM protein [Nanoarchaeota archaeon]|nr:radical SAM protein [Nanoarchaeota archaeon]